jgi:hypothetical protein
MDLIDIYREFAAEPEDTHLGQRLIGAMIEAGDTNMAAMKAKAKQTIKAELSKAISEGKANVNFSDNDLRDIVSKLAEETRT